MSINLNSSTYDIKPLVTKEGILSHVNVLSIYKTYVEGYDGSSNVLLKSPLRGDDSNPSLGIFYSKIHNTFLFKDLGSGEVGDCFRYVQLLYGCTYFEALSIICRDFGLDKYFSCKPHYKSGKYIKYATTTEVKDFIEKNTKFNLQITSRKFRDYDYGYWGMYGITKETLQLYQVTPVSYIHINDMIVKADSFCYAYIEYKDGITTYKIYQPFSLKYKWLTNAPASVHQGYKQLADSGDLLIITKSLKDVMSIRDVLGISAIAIQCETVYIKPTVIEEYQNRFKQVITLFDNDRQGKEWAQVYKNHYNLEPIFIPDIYKQKDFSDLVRYYGPSRSQTIYNKLIQKI